MIRFILGEHPRFHLDNEHFEKLNILNVDNRVEYLTLTLMHSVFYGSAPTYLKNCFSLRDNENIMRTRRSINSFIIPRVKSHGLKTFRFQGAKLWNELNTSLKKCSDKTLFKKYLKKLLSNRMTDSE